MGEKTFHKVFYIFGGQMFQYACFIYWLMNKHTKQPTAPQRQKFECCLLPQYPHLCHSVSRGQHRDLLDYFSVGVFQIYERWCKVLNLFLSLQLHLFEAELMETK